MNNRPLSYLEDDIEFPILTPNSFVLQQSNVVPELEGHHIKDGDLRKRAKYLRNIKNHLWSRWQREYLTSLRQRYQTNHRSVTGHPKEGDIVLIKGEEKNRNKWKIGKVTKLIRGKDKVVRGVQCDKAKIERPIQLIYPLELKCDARKCETKLNTTAREFKQRIRNCSNWKRWTSDSLNIWDVHLSSPSESHGGRVLKINMYSIGTTRNI